MNDRYDFNEMVERGNPGDVFKIVDPEDGMYIVLVKDIDQENVPLFLPDDNVDASDIELGSELSWIHRGKIFEHQPQLNGIFGLQKRKG